MTSQPPTLAARALPDGVPPRRAARSRAALWPWVPALLLVSLLGTQLAVLSATLDDPAFATEPDYYRKALDWDSLQARARQSQALGWAARATAVPGERASGAVSISLAIDDGHGLPVSGAAVRAQAFPNVRARQVRELGFREASPGVYVAELGAARPGIWELRASAARGEQQFETTLRLELGAPGVEP